jgi:hypothetical protein
MTGTDSSTASSLSQEIFPFSIPSQIPWFEGPFKINRVELRILYDMVRLPRSTSMIWCKDVAKLRTGARFRRRRRTRWSPRVPPSWVAAPLSLLLSPYVPIRWDHSGPSILSPMDEIGMQNTPSPGLILASHPAINSSYLMKTHRPAPWTRSMSPWTYFIAFLTEK